MSDAQEKFEQDRLKKESKGWSRGRSRRGSPGRGMALGRGDKTAQKPTGGQPGANKDHVKLQSDKDLLRSLVELPDPT